MVQHAGGVAALYRVPGGLGSAGAFVRTPAGPVGTNIDREATTNLALAVLVAQLDTNPSLARAEEDEDGNAGWGVSTSENALLYSHRFESDLYTAYETGTMTRISHFGVRIGENRDVIEPPNDLSIPFLGNPDLDEVYATATLDLLSSVTAESPDLAGAIRWLQIVWANAAIVEGRPRILAIRAGFDTLFGSSDTEEVRDALTRLLDPDGEPVAQRAWTTLTGRAKSASLSDLGWWFQHFSFLRNKIAHGGALETADFAWDGVSHIARGEWTLRRAIKRTVSDATGHEELLIEDRFEREMHRATKRAEQELRERDARAAD
jgi:hypothetical protein